MSDCPVAVHLWASPPWSEAETEKPGRELRVRCEIGSPLCSPKEVKGSKESSNKTLCTPLTDLETPSLHGQGSLEHTPAKGSLLLPPGHNQTAGTHTQTLDSGLVSL